MLDRRNSPASPRGRATDGTSHPGIDYTPRAYYDAPDVPAALRAAPDLAAFVTIAYAAEPANDANDDAAAADVLGEGSRTALGALMRAAASFNVARFAFVKVPNGSPKFFAALQETVDAENRLAAAALAYAAAYAAYHAEDRG